MAVMETRKSVYSLVALHSLMELDHARCLKREIVFPLAKIVAL